jgi:hypothetical protein
LLSPQHEPEDVALLCAESDADADFPCAENDDIADGAEDAHGCKQKADEAAAEAIAAARLEVAKRVVM